MFGPAQTLTVSAETTTTNQASNWNAAREWDSAAAPEWNTTTNTNSNEPASDWNVEPVQTNTVDDSWETGRTQNADNTWDTDALHSVDNGWDSNPVPNNNADNAWDTGPVHTTKASTNWNRARAPVRDSARTQHRLHMGNRRRAASSSSSSSQNSSPVTAPGTTSTVSRTSKPNQWSSRQGNDIRNPTRGTIRRPWTAQRIAQLRSIAIPKDEPEVVAPPVSEVKNLISVNKEGQRVDRPLSAPTVDALQAFHDLRTKPCQHLAINGHCQFGSACEFDHTPLDEDMIHAMRWTLRHNPCIIGMGCRWQQCKRGHKCQKTGCLSASIPRKSCFGVFEIFLCTFPRPIRAHAGGSANYSQPSRATLLTLCD